jgi:hypothetical protein
LAADVAEGAAGGGGFQWFWSSWGISFLRAGRFVLLSTL